MKKAISFISDLEKNNQRDWFQKNKDRYNEARSDFLQNITRIIDQLQIHDPRISGLEAKDAMFRIYRDIRFSNDKTPYKTHFAAYIARGGRKSKEAGYYIHAGNDELFIAAGVYSPDKEDLYAIRQEILYQPDTFREIINEKQRAGFETYEKDKLKTGPKNFPKDSPHADLLRYKHFLLTTNLNEDAIERDRFAKEAAEALSQLVSFTDFLNMAMEFKGNE